MIDYKTIISTTDSKVTLMQWLQALTEEFGDAKIKSVTFDVSTTRLSLTIQKEDGTAFTTTQVLYSLTADEQSLINNLIKSVTAFSDGVTFSKAVSFQGNESHNGSEIHNGYASFLGDENHAGSEMHKGTATFTDLRSDDLTATDGQELVSWDGTTTALKGKADRPTYNGGDLALKSDVSAVSDIYYFCQNATQKECFKNADLTGKTIHVINGGNVTDWQSTFRDVKCAKLIIDKITSVQNGALLSPFRASNYQADFEITDGTGTAGITNFDATFYQAGWKSLPWIDTSSGTSFIYFAASYGSGAVIPAYDLSKAENLSDAFYHCWHVTSFLATGMKVSFSLADCPLLSGDAARVVIDNVATITDGSGPTLTLNSATKEQLNADDITTLNNKGWNLA